MKVIRAMMALACVCCLLPGVVGAQFDESAEEIAGAVSSSEDVAETVETVGKPGEIFSVAPLIITEKGKPRDIIKDTITITNNTPQRVDLYADVKNFDPAAGQEAFGSLPGDHVAESLGNWIEITRGVIELDPGETVYIPYLIHINLRAKPGTYHAQIRFARGSNRKQAYENSSTIKEIMMSVEVMGDAHDKLQLEMFLPDQGVFSGDEASFSLGLENVGNTNVVPRGEIRIYNRRGQEVASLPANAAGDAMAPEAKQQLAAVWDASGRFGKYKAYLDLEYGQTGSVQDTVYFWIFPWREVLIGFTLLLILAASVTYLIHLRLTYAYAPATAGRAYVQPAEFQSYPDQEPEPEPETHIAVKPMVYQPSKKEYAKADAVAIPARASGGVHTIALRGVSKQPPAGHVVRIGGK